MCANATLTITFTLGYSAAHRQISFSSGIEGCAVGVIILL